MAYNFREQLSRGSHGEAVLDAYFREHWDITPASVPEQRLGIDRWFVSRTDPAKRGAVEYKTDHTAGRTHNAFIETVSVDTAGKPGWAYTSAARILMYYVPSAGRVYIVPLTALRRVLPRWSEQYPQRQVPNEGYCTRGLLVPLSELASVALRVISVVELML